MKLLREVAKNPTRAGGELLGYIGATAVSAGLPDFGKALKEASAAIIGSCENTEARAKVSELIEATVMRSHALGIATGRQQVEQELAEDSSRPTRRTEFVADPTSGQILGRSSTTCEPARRRLAIKEKHERQDR